VQKDSHAHIAEEAGCGREGVVGRAASCLADVETENEGGQTAATASP
jgi:hypothetical protein